MSAILVVETDASYAQRISKAMQAAGLAVEVCENAESAMRRAAVRPPRLIVASSAIPEVRSLLGRFARAQRGPGAVVMIPTTLVGRVSAKDYRADAILPKPFTSEEARQVLLPMITPPETMRPQQLSSAEIFGDVLAEVEGKPAAAGAAASVRTRPSASSTDIDRKLEETLSGVLPLSEPRRQPSGAKAPRTRVKPSATQDVDKLLDKTLSSLELPRKKKRLRTAGEAPIPRSAGETPVQAPTPVPPPPQPPAGAPSAQEPPLVPSAFATTALPSLSQILAEEKLDPPPVPSPPPEAQRPQIEPSAFATTTLPAMSGGATDPAPVMPAPLETLHSGDGVLPDEGTPAEDAPAKDVEPVFEPLPPLEVPPLQEEPAPQATIPHASQVPPAENFRTQRLSIVTPRETSEGEAFGDYTLLRRIALGGMAEVWQARRRGVEGFQKTVAIKKILSHLTGSSDFVTMFIDEAKLAAQLNHNNIIQIYDLGKVGEDFFIAMEYVDGMDVRTILNTARQKRRPMPMRLALLIADSVARALDYAHRKRDFDNQALGLVHRDVSPQNILIGYEGEIKLCDFGIVKAVAKASTTQMGALKGKLQYMSPEQAWGKSVDARSDIFSLGSVLFEILTDTRLFTGDSEIGVLDAVRECRVRNPQELVPELPEDVDRIVRRALAKEATERYQTAGEMEEDLKNVIFNLKPMPSPGELASYLEDLESAPEPVPEEAEPPAARSVPDAVPVPTDFQSAPLPEATATSTEPGGTELGAQEAGPADLPAVAAAPPKPPSVSDQGTGRGRTWVKVLVGAGVLAAVATAAFFLWRYVDGRTAGPPPAAAPPDTPVTAPPPAPETELAEPAAQEPSGTISGGPVAEEAASQEAGGPPAEADAPAVEGLDLQGLVDQELARQREEIEKKLDEEFAVEKRKLERELEAARKAAEEEGGGG